MEDRGLPAREFAARFASLRNGQLARRQVLRLGNLLHILFRLCPPMPFRLFNTWFVWLLKSQMSKNFPRLIAYGSLAASRGPWCVTFAPRRPGNPRGFLYIIFWVTCISKHWATFTFYQSLALGGRKFGP